MDKTIHLGVWIVVSLLVGALFTMIAMPTKHETIAVASQCAALPALSCPTPVLNVSDTDNGWKEQALQMASDEWSLKDNKAIYLVLKNIDEREDISRIDIKDFSFDSSDSFSKDAVINQELRVYYEDHHGKDIKAYVNVVTTISNGEVEDQEINLD
jgi:hypothetical protein